MNISDKRVKGRCYEAMWWHVSRLVFANESMKVVTVRNRENSQLYSVQRQ